MYTAQCFIPFIHQHIYGILLFFNIKLKMKKLFLFYYLLSSSIILGDAISPVISSGFNSITLDQQKTEVQSTITFLQNMIIQYEVAFASFRNDGQKFLIKQIKIIDKNSPVSFNISVKYDVISEPIPFPLRWIVAQPQAPLIVGNNLNIKSSNRPNTDNCDRQIDQIKSSTPLWNLATQSFKVILFIEVMPKLLSRDLNFSLIGKIEIKNQTKFLCYRTFNSVNSPTASFVIIINPPTSYIFSTIFRYSSWSMRFQIYAVSVIKAATCKDNCFFGISSVSHSKPFLQSQLVQFSNIYLKLKDDANISMSLIKFNKIRTNTSRIQCDPDWKCHECNQTGCVNCPTASYRELSEDLFCQCIYGYYENEICKKCNFECRACDNPYACFECIEGYILSIKRCNIFLPNLTYTIYQSLNNVTVTLYSKIRIVDSTAFDIILDGESIFPTMRLFTNIITLSFQIKKEVSTLEIYIKNQDANLNAKNSQPNIQVIDLKDIHFYTSKQKLVLQITGLTAEGAAQVSNFGRLVCVIFGGLYLMAGLIQTVNMMAFYIFISMRLPSNLRFILHTFYACLDSSIVPFDMPDLFSSEDDSFNQPYCLNFISKNIFSIIQLCIFITLYFAIGNYVRKLRGLHWISQFLISQFRNVYKNSAEAFLSCQIPLCFACASVLLDLHISSLYKAINLAVGVLFMFAFAILPLLHPFYLYTVKENTQIDTSECYSKAKRHEKWSEVYVFSKYLLGSIMAIVIPLAPPLVALCLMIAISCVQVFSASKTTFYTTFMKVSRISYSLTHCVLHCVLLSIFLIDHYYKDTIVYSENWMLLGYVALGLICLNILHDFTLIIYQLALIIKKLRSLKWKTQKPIQLVSRQIQIQPKQKRVTRKQKSVLLPLPKQPLSQGLSLNQESNITLKKSKMDKIRRLMGRLSNRQQVLPKPLMLIEVRNRQP